MRDPGDRRRYITAYIGSILIHAAALVAFAALLLSAIDFSDSESAVPDTTITVETERPQPSLAPPVPHVATPVPRRVVAVVPPPLPARVRPRPRPLPAVQRELAHIVPKAPPQPTPPPPAPVVAALPAPTALPTERPTQTPTERPRPIPTEPPTIAPTERPTIAPTERPTAAPAEPPTAAPTSAPAQRPTVEPTTRATAVAERPTAAPSAVATAARVAVASPRPAATTGSASSAGAGTAPGAAHTAGPAAAAPAPIAHTAAPEAPRAAPAPVVVATTAPSAAPGLGSLNDRLKGLLPTKPTAHMEHVNLGSGYQTDRVLSAYEAALAPPLSVLAKTFGLIYTTNTITHAGSVEYVYEHIHSVIGHDMCRAWKIVEHPKRPVDVAPNVSKPGAVSFPGPLSDVKPEISTEVVECNDKNIVPVEPGSITTPVPRAR